MTGSDLPSFVNLPMCSWNEEEEVKQRSQIMICNAKIFCPVFNRNQKWYSFYLQFTPTDFLLHIFFIKFSHSKEKLIEKADKCVVLGMWEGSVQWRNSAHLQEVALWQWAI